jgi:hypothetical protein
MKVDQVSIVDIKYLFGTIIKVRRKAFEKRLSELSIHIRNKQT